MSQSINIVAADDHLLFLQGLEGLLKLNTRFNLLDVATDGNQLLTLIEKYQPDIALTDLSMGGADTKQIIEQTELVSQSTDLIALTMHLDPIYINQLMELGLSGYVLKESAFDELSEAIVEVYQGNQFLSAQILTLMNASHCHQEHKALLSTREKEVLTGAAKGRSNKEIARALDITERTVRFHLANCCIKLKSQGRVNAVAIALKKALIEV